MGNILDRYGIKEVADVTFYALDEDGEKGAPVLYLDTLKVSTIEQTAEETEARGGKGNAPLIIWDFGKEINLTLEDALFSMKSLATMYGGKVQTSTGSITKTISFRGPTTPTKWTAPDGKEYSITPTVYDENSNVVTTPVAGKDYIAVFQLTGAEVQEIDIFANTFPGTYAIVGETYARSEGSGVDEPFQFEIARAKIQSENTIEMSADGDPSTFSLNVRVLRPATGPMMTLTKFAYEPVDNEPVDND